MDYFDWKATIQPNILKLRLAGLWLDGDETYKLNLYTLWAAVSIFAFIFAHNFFQVVNIFFVFDDLQAVTATIFVNLSELLTILKTYYVIRNTGVLKQLMLTLECELFQPSSPHQIRLAEPNLRFWKWCHNLFWLMSSGALFFWAAYPIMDDSIKDHKLPFSAWYPYSTETSPLYEVTYIYQILSISFIAATTLSIDLLIAALNIYIGAQFDVLGDNLKHLFDHVRDETEFTESFVECVRHHREVLKFAADCDKFYRWIVFFQFFISALSIGITMFQLTVVPALSPEFFSFLLFGLAITVEIFVYCWSGNEAETKSQQIPYACFESEWTSAPLYVQKHLVFFILRTQKPLKVYSALNLFYLALDTFARILSTAWSYFTLLHRVNTK